MAIILAFVAGLTDLIGGFAPLFPRLKFISTRYVLAFASGTVISAAFFELLPEANIEANWALVGIGFFVMYLIDKGLSLHQCGESECEVTGVSWITVLGMASDNIIDGAGIAVAYLTDPRLGFLVTLAVVAHEIPQGYTTTLVMRSQNYRFSRIIGMLLLAAIMYPIGATIGSLIPESVHQAAIGFVAGVFIYTGASTLMTEAHRHFNKWVILFLMIGALISLGLKFIE
ncbi:MAG: ZIP family metal transporter [Chloroflexi bacterium]|nr:ZIP family metal transporter [Chloroflexota bacterium]